MARPKAPKGLEVNGTPKLAAKAKASDKHEKPNLNIEEATIASPRPSRKRAGDFFDFDGGDSADGSYQGTATASENEKPRKKTKATATDKTDKTSKDEAKTAGKEKKAKITRNSGTQELKEKTSKVSTKVATEKGKVVSSRRSKKEAKQPIDPKDLKTEDPLEPPAEITKSKPSKSRATSKSDSAQEKSAIIPSNMAMDEGPFQGLLESNQGLAPGVTAGESVDGKKEANGKGIKKPNKGPKAASAKTVREATNEAGTVATDALEKGAKYVAEKAKKAAESSAQMLQTAVEATNTVANELGSSSEQIKRTAMSKVSVAETAAGGANAGMKKAKTGAEKAKRGVKPKENGRSATKDKSTKHQDVVKETAPIVKESEPDAKPKKRKDPSEYAGTVKSDLLDPLAEHAEVSAKKKQKKEKGKTKSLGDAVSDLISSAAEGANAARASIGGLANSILGGAVDVAETTGDAITSAQFKGSGEAAIKMVTESYGKSLAGQEAPTESDKDGSASDTEPDDQTAALLAGFESDGDEAPGSGAGFVNGEKIPQVPDAKKVGTKIKAINADSDEGPGVIYVGRIPHGFYEHEMRQYFSQFGDISRLRLSRNRKTGASRHWAFIEFKSAGVAKIVAQTMDNYLMFGHILKCKAVPREQLHENVWKGANKRFKKVPWNAKQRREQDKAVGRDQWNARNEKEEKRRESKKEKMKEIGYEFDAPPLTSVDEVPVKDCRKENNAEQTIEEEQSLVTAGPEDGVGLMVISEEIKTRNTEISAKGEPKETTTSAVRRTKRVLEAGEDAAEVPAKKTKKVKKMKRDVE